MHKYTNDEIEVTFDLHVCTHSGVCVRGLGQVFDVKKKPWVNMLGAPSEEIAAQVERCPSGALQWKKREAGNP
jgi:uncharacterized Fe-S cluster protein YjdI